MSYVFTLTPQGGAATTLPATTTLPYALTGLLPLTTYTLGVQATCANGGQTGYQTTTFTTGNPLDEPATALPLTSSATCQPTAATTARATTTVPSGYANPGCGGASPQPNDVWFRFTTAATGLASTGATLSVSGDRGRAGARVQQRGRGGRAVHGSGLRGGQLHRGGPAAGGGRPHGQHHVLRERGRLQRHGHLGRGRSPSA